ncbi:hypothetical protein MMC10_007731 [Thelotrema lepadinum]|nr:hypothetical protein [Thelotrema lepadinum]
MSKVDTQRPDVVAFIEEASKALGRAIPPAKDVFGFGNGLAYLDDRLLERAISGAKTATTSWPVPDPLYWGPGDYSVILNGKGEPAALMHTNSFRQCKFKDVEEEFALAEAEGDYESYREGHFWHYGRGENGHLFSDESEVLCERFEVVYHRPQEKPEG